MNGRRFSITPDSALEILLGANMLEEHQSGMFRYRAAINEYTNRPYTKTDLVEYIYRYTGHVMKYKASGSPARRVINRMINEFKVHLLTKKEHNQLRWDFSDTVQKWLEFKLGIDLSIVDFRRWRSNWGALRRRILRGVYTEEQALIMFKQYYDRMVTGSKDCRVGKPFNFFTVRVRLDGESIEEYRRRRARERRIERRERNKSVRQIVGNTDERCHEQKEDVGNTQGILH